MAFNLFAEMAKETKSRDDVKQSELVYISVDKLIPSEDNFYSTDEISDLMAAIELVGGVTQNLTVTQIQGTDTYKIIEGHRRHKASSQLVAEGKQQFSIVPCVIKKSAVTNTEKALEELQLICSNSTTRTLSDFEKVTQIARLKELINQLKAEGYKISGRTRDIIAETLNTSTAQVGRMESINRNLTDSFKKELAEENIGVSVAYELSTMPEAAQQQVFKNYKGSGELSLKDVKKPKPKEAETSAPVKQTAPQTVEDNHAEEIKPKQQELKPCPFCGGGSNIFNQQDFSGNVHYWVECQNCGAKSGEFISTDKGIVDAEKIVAKAWNTRI